MNHSRDSVSVIRTLKNGGGEVQTQLRFAGVGERNTGIWGVVDARSPLRRWALLVTFPTAAGCEV